MKSIVFVLSALFVTSAYAKDVVVKGSKARSVMEAVAASGFEVSNIQEEWQGKTLEVGTGPILCRYTAVYYPDDWMSSVDCYKGETQAGEALPNSLALAKAIQKYAVSDAGVGNRWLAVKDVACKLNYDSKKYSCTVTTEDQQQK